MTYQRTINSHYRDSYRAQAEREIAEASKLPAEDVRESLMRGIAHEANRERHERWLERQGKKR